MAEKGIVPIKISLTEGDFYTLWAPSWRQHGTEWQAFLGKDDDLYVFNSEAELLAFLESGERHDLTSHPQWDTFNSETATRVVVDHDSDFDIIGAPKILAGRPSYENVKELSRIFHITRSLGEVTGASPVSVFFSSHSVLSNVDRGATHYAGATGFDEWTAVGRAILSNWDRVVDALDEQITIKEIPENEAREAEEAINNALIARREELEAQKNEEKEAELPFDPYDVTAWSEAGIDPIKITIDGQVHYSLRTYVGGRPVFLGKLGEIFTFNEPKKLISWILSHDNHDLFDLPTWDSLVKSIKDGDVEFVVHSDNVYTFTGLKEAINTSVEAVETNQMATCYELMADAADWAEDDSMNSFFLANPRMQDYISYMLGASDRSGYVPHAPFDDHAKSWDELEVMLRNRFSK